MGLDSHGRDEELVGNLVVAVALYDEVEDLLLPVGQLVGVEKAAVRGGGFGELPFQVEVFNHNIGDLDHTKPAIEEGEEEGAVGKLKVVDEVIGQEGDKDKD